MSRPFARGATQDTTIRAAATFDVAFSEAVKLDADGGVGMPGTVGRVATVVDMPL
jgi:hypothetical protein